MTAKVIRHNLLNFSDVFYNIKEVRSYFRDRVHRHGFRFNSLVAVRV